MIRQKGASANANTTLQPTARSLQKYPAAKYAENPQQKAPSDEFSTAKSSKLRFGFFINSLLGLKFLYLLNKHQSSAQAKTANAAAKIAAFGVSSIGKICQNQSRRPPTKPNQSKMPPAKQARKPPAKRADISPPYEIIPLLCTHRS